MKKWFVSAMVVISILGINTTPVKAGENLVTDPGFEVPKEPDKNGRVFKNWDGWIYAKPGAMCVSSLAHTGKHSGLIVCDTGGKVRFYEKRKTFAPGRYRLTFYMRALDAQKARRTFSIASLDGVFHEKFPDLPGTFGWRKVTHVVDVSKEIVNRINLGLNVAGRVWFDDVMIEKVGEDVALTVKPQFGPVEQKIEMPGEMDPAAAMSCSDCGYRNMPAWKNCYACGEKLKNKVTTVLPPKVIASFEDGKKKPFSNGEVVDAHATNGSKALKWSGGYSTIDGPQDWTGYDFFKADFFFTGNKPLKLYVEIRDKETKGYWTRVNHSTTLMPGKNTVVVLTNIFVGEKARPGRNLILDKITRFVFNVGKAEGDVYLDNVRLECDDSDKDRFPGLYAFDFGKPDSPLLRGMTRITAGTRYSKGRGFGLLKAKVWRSYDVLQPDVVYRDFVCIEKGGMAIDVKNGKYHVFVNIDCPGGYWGELPRYRSRKVLAEGKEVAVDSMDRDKAIWKYFRFADQDDLYTDNTFDKYLGTIFKEKEFEVDVTDGQLNVEFVGRDWSNCVSCMVVFPLEKRAEGMTYLASLKERRRKDFDNYFRRQLHVDKNPIPEAGKDKGYCIFVRDYMDPVYPNTKPLVDEITNKVSAFAFNTEYEPLTFSVWSHKALGKVDIKPTDLKGPGTINAAAIKVGYVSNRVSRKGMDGTVYTIGPRFVMNTASVELQENAARRFWATVKVPEDAPAGKYTGALELVFANGGKDRVAVDLEVFGPPLEPLDVPAGPWGLPIRTPWFDDEMTDFNRSLDEKSLAILHEYGFNTFSMGLGMRMQGKGKDLTLDYSNADRIMKMAREAGMTAFMNYGSAVGGLNVYGYGRVTDPTKYGFDTMAALYKHVFSQMDKHAAEANWLLLIITACDEPHGQDEKNSAANAALLKACATERIRFAGATSMTEKKKHRLPLVQNMDIANYNTHDTWSIEEAKKTGGWAFYNGGNRWTYGYYMFMLRQKYDMKFRYSWHWNINAGDPYYALDCREDDYAWANANARGELVHATRLELLREGVDDYRYLLTLKKLLEKKPGHAAATAAKKILDEVMNLVPGKDRGKSALWPVKNKGKGLREKRYEIGKLIRQLRGK